MNALYVHYCTYRSNNYNDHENMNFAVVRTQYIQLNRELPIHDPTVQSRISSFSSQTYHI